MLCVLEYYQYFIGNAFNEIFFCISAFLCMFLK